MSTHITDDNSGLKNTFLSLYWESPGFYYINEYFYNNYAPVLSGSQAILPQVKPGGSFVISSSDLLKGFTDPEGDDLHISDVRTEYGY